MSLTPLTPRQQALIVSNVLKACNDVEKLNSTGYKYLNLCSGFIAHYNLQGFKAYYSEHSLKRDIESNYRQNQWRNFSSGEENAAYLGEATDGELVYQCF